MRRSGADGLYWLQTERCRLRRFTLEDRAWLGELYADEEITRYLGGVKSPAAVDEMLRSRILDYYDANPGLGIWVTESRQDGERLGFHLLNHIQGETIVQVGYTLSRAAWGRGVATEMAAALLGHGFETLRLPSIAGMTSLGNLASQRVLLKIGLERRGERAFAHPAYAAEGPLAWFERDAGSWLEWRAGSSRPS